jgi:hypothetical protein
MLFGIQQNVVVVVDDSANGRANERKWKLEREEKLVGEHKEEAEEIPN